MHKQLAVRVNVNENHLCSLMPAQKYLVLDQVNTKVQVRIHKIREERFVFFVEAKHCETKKHENNSQN